MEIKRLRTLALETINGLNPNFKNNIFSIKPSHRVTPNDILVKAHKSATF